jgi:hypothetical protein
MDTPEQAAQVYPIETATFVTAADVTFTDSAVVKQKARGYLTLEFDQATGVFRMTKFTPVPLAGLYGM